MASADLAEQADGLGVAVGGLTVVAALIVDVAKAVPNARLHAWAVVPAEQVKPPVAIGLALLRVAKGRMQISDVVARYGSQPQIGRCVGEVQAALAAAGLA